jgi:predicted component of type VI protein secretion system
VQNQIETTIENYEPRVNNVQVDVNPIPDDNAFEITVIFDIIGQEVPTQQFTFLLEATR